MKKFATTLVTKHLFFILALVLFSACQSISTTIVDVDDYNETIRVACIGNSITYGYGINQRDSLSYPAQLQGMLGDKFDVRNFGISARTLLSKGDRPYINEPIYTEALQFNPHVVLIKLGTNDTKPQNWVYQSEYKNDYKALIKSFQHLESKPIVVLLKAVPAFPERWGITDSVIFNGVNPKIVELGNELNLPVIDLYTSLKPYADLFPDFIHPNAKGAGIMAKVIKMELVGE